MSKIDELLKNEKVEWKKLGDIFNVRTGYTPSKSKKDYWTNGTINWFTIEDIREKGNKLYAANKKINKSAVKKSTFKSNSIVLSTIATVGEHALILTDFVINQQFIVFTLKEYFENKINMYYLNYYFYRVGEYCRKHKRIGNIPTVDSELILKLDIPIPSIETQEKIVETLDKFTNYVTELQAELQARNKQYEYYRDMLLSEEYLNKISMKMNMLTNKDYELKMTTLGEIAQVNRGASPRPIKKYITEDIKGIPWIKIGDVGVNSKYVTKTAQKITREGAKKSRILKKGDFIISNSMSYGRPYILGIDGAIHDGWASISGFHNTLDSDFLYYYLTSSKVQNYWKGKINSSSVNNLNSEIICSLPIPVINKELQQVVAKVLDKFQSLLADTNGLLPEEIEQRQKQYEYYREKLLTFEEECDSKPQAASRKPQNNS